jgi:hypothetical protein
VNNFRIEMALEPRAFRHMVIVDNQRLLNRARLSCLCGFRTEWMHPSQLPHPAATTHPHMEVTRSRTDLRPLPLSTRTEIQ